jgi:hypothetical protein
MKNKKLIKFLYNKNSDVQIFVTGYECGYDFLPRTS